MCGVKTILHVIRIRVGHDFVDRRRACSKAEGYGSLVKDLVGHDHVSHGLGRELVRRMGNDLNAPLGVHFYVGSVEGKLCMLWRCRYFILTDRIGHRLT